MLARCFPPVRTNHGLERIFPCAASQPRAQDTGKRARKDKIEKPVFQSSQVIWAKRVLVRNRNESQASYGNQSSNGKSVRSAQKACSNTGHAGAHDMDVKNVPTHPHLVKALEADTAAFRPEEAVDQHHAHGKYAGSGEPGDCDA